MDAKSIDKILLILGFLMTTGAVVVGYTNPATTFELSIYSSTPIYFWALIVSSLLIGTFLTFQRSSVGSRTPIVLVGISFTTIMLLPVFRGYQYLREGDPMAHLGWTKEILAGEVDPMGFLYPGVHLLSAQMKVISGVGVEHAILLTTTSIAILFLIFVPLSVRVVSDRQRGPLFGLFAGMTFLPLLQNDPISFSPRFQAYFLTPMVLYFCLSIFKYDRDLYFLLSLLGFTTLTTFHPQQSMHFLLAVGAITLYLLVRVYNSNRTYLPTRTLLLFSTSTGVIFWTYVNRQSRFVSGVYSYAHQFLRRVPGEEAVNAGSSSLSELGVSLVELLLRIGLANIVFSLFAGLLFLIILVRRDWNLQVESIIIGVGTLSVLFVVLFVLGSGALRVFGFLMVWITVLGTIAATRFDTALRSYTRFLSPVIPLIVVGLFLFSLLTLFNSPFILFSSGHVMEGHFDGYETTFEYTNREDSVDFVRSASFRYYQGLEGMEQHRTSGLTIGRQVPDHFANQSLRTHYTENTYIAITSADYERDAIMYEGFRYSKQDFEYLRTAKHVNKVYDSNEFRLYHIP